MGEVLPHYWSYGKCEDILQHHYWLESLHCTADNVQHWLLRGDITIQSISKAGWSPDTIWPDYGEMKIKIGIIVDVSFVRV